VMAGINDLLMGKGCWPRNPTALRAIGNVTALRSIEMMETLMEKLPATHFILSLILPAGDFADGDEKWRWPNPLTLGILAANEWIAKAFGAEDRVTVLDCGPLYLPTGSWIEPTLQGDGLHPSEEGVELLAKCFAPHVEQGMRGPRRQQPSQRTSERHLDHDSQRSRSERDKRRHPSQLDNVGSESREQNQSNA